MPRLDHPGEYSRTGRGGRDPFRSAETLHPRRNHPLGSVARSRIRSNARARGTLRLEGKEYIVQDGDVMHIRHSG